MFTAGACLLMSGFLYEVKKTDKHSYLLAQTVIEHEEGHVKQEYWKRLWVDQHAKKVSCDEVKLEQERLIGC